MIQHKKQATQDDKFCSWQQLKDKCEDIKNMMCFIHQEKQSGGYVPLENKFMI